jgi:LytS/YehU family sensor histidine kinase
VYKDAELAEEFVRRFAHTYQYVLDTHKKDLIPISEEIEFVNAYAFLLQTRFSNNIKLIINLSSEAKESLIPPLTLQILVENAVKHNTISDEHPLQIEVYQEAERLCVKNTISETPKQVSSLKVGLENIKKRYEYFTPTELELLNGENFEVKLPILKAREQALV